MFKEAVSLLQSLNVECVPCFQSMFTVCALPRTCGRRCGAGCEAMCPNIDMYIYVYIHMRERETSVKIYIYIYI